MPTTGTAYGSASVGRAMFDSPGQASFQVMFLPATLVSYVRRATPPDFRHTHT